MVVYSSLKTDTWTWTLLDATTESADQLGVEAAYAAVLVELKDGDKI